MRPHILLCTLALALTVAACDDGDSSGGFRPGTADSTVTEPSSSPVAVDARTVTLHVAGMMKSRSGAT